MGVPVDDVVIEDGQARLTDEARLDRFRYAAAAGNENIYPGDVRVETVRDSGRLASERPSTGDEVEPENLERVNVSVSGAAEDRIIQSQVDEEAVVSAENQEEDLGFLERHSQNISEFRRSAGDKVEDVVPSAEIGASTTYGRVGMGIGLDEVAGGVTEFGVGLANLPGHALAAREAAEFGFDYTAQTLINRQPLGPAGISSIPSKEGREETFEAAESGIEAGQASVEAFKEEPGRTTGMLAGSIVAGFGASTLALRGGRAVSSARRASGGRTRSGSSAESSAITFERTLAGDDRGQAALSDLVPDRGRTSRDSGDSAPDTDMELARQDVLEGSPRDRISSDLYQGSLRQRREMGGDYSGRFDPIGRDRPQATFDPRDDILEWEPPAQTTTGQATTTATRSDPRRLVRGPLSRARAASTPAWAAGSVLPRGDEDTGVSDYAGRVRPLLSQQSSTGMQIDEDEEVDMASLIEDAQAPAVTDDDDTVVGVGEDTATTPGQDTGTKAGSDTDTPADKDRPTTPGQFEPFPQSPRPARPTFTTPRPSRPRPRPRTPDIDGPGFNLDFGDDEGGMTSVDRTKPRTQPGWFSEHVTDIGTLGTELPGTPSQTELEAVSDPVTSASDLPTSQVLAGDEDVAAAADMLGGGVDLDLDFDLGGGGV